MSLLCAFRQAYIRIFDQCYPGRLLPEAICHAAHKSGCSCSRDHQPVGLLQLKVKVKFPRHANMRDIQERLFPLKWRQPSLHAMHKSLGIATSRRAGCLSAESPTTTWTFWGFCPDMIEGTS